MPINNRPSDEFISLLKQSGDADVNVAQNAQREFAKALELPLRKGVLVGNIDDISYLDNYFSNQSVTTPNQQVSLNNPEIKQIYTVNSQLEEIKRKEHQAELDNIETSRKRLEESYHARVKVLEEREHELQEELKAIAPANKEKEKLPLI